MRWFMIKLALLHFGRARRRREPAIETSIPPTLSSGVTIPRFTTRTLAPEPVTSAVSPVPILIGAI